MTEKMPSSVSVGSRPSALTIRWYSSSFRPWRSRVALSCLAVSAHADALSGCRQRARGMRRNDRLEHDEAIGTADRQLARALRMRHQADNVATFVADASNRLDRAVRVCVIGYDAGFVHVTEHDLAILLELAELVRSREVIALAVRDRNPQHLLRRARERKRRIGLLHAHMNVLAAKLQLAVAQHRTRQKPGLEEDLEAVADAEHRPARRRRTS